MASTTFLETPRGWTFIHVSNEKFKATINKIWFIPPNTCIERSNFLKKRFHKALIEQIENLNNKGFASKILITPHFFVVYRSFKRIEDL